MKVFMLGWEFPPFISGGLGTACYGLTKGLDAIGVKVTFVLPSAVPVDTSSHVDVKTPADLASVKPAKLTTAHDAAEIIETPGGISREMVEMVSQFKHLEVRQVAAQLQAYGNPSTVFHNIVEELVRQGVTTTLAQSAVEAAITKAAPAGQQTAAAPLPDVPEDSSPIVETGGGSHYAGDLMQQVSRYAAMASRIAMNEEFDVVHAHDWMTYPAGLAVAGVTGKPLVVHVHSTEFDRSGENVNQRVYDIERAGIHGADKVICVSRLTRNIVISRYGARPDDTDVVYNAVVPNSKQKQIKDIIAPKDKIVLFLGRITMQKGPEYFLAAAKKVLEVMPNVRFVMAGSGDMIRKTIELAASMGIGQKVAFTGFLRGADVDRVFDMADLYVMPSVSEPFGIAPLEALSHNVPVLISKQSGVSEVLTHVLKVDFWDIEEMANKILAVLKHPPLKKVLQQHGDVELKKLSWEDSAQSCERIYRLAQR